MAQPKLVFAGILLVLSLFHCIHSSEGRNLKPLRKNELPKLTTRSVLFEKETNEVAEKESDLHGKSTKRTANESVPMAPLPTMLPMSQMPPTLPSQIGTETRVPPPGHVDDFRPTTPGHSPGVGHSLQN
ncbi:hypothetical protein RHSIM_Rhsim10G0119400 [Rhododendron simsii]|uniref:Uncharacterized protein n=1 Tax=Rhododendron simsii TaxID=118357 RepID=A0A834G9Y1_RHOSS|nr:hypothetical protein RHSIM_Rhsim10G0119400 [Rhododendron simsii]